MPKDPLVDLMDMSAGEATPANITVPNIKPKLSNAQYKLAIIGEAPGKDEIDQGKPFVGYSGRTLDNFLSKFGILRDACFIGNVCQHRPPANKIAAFDWDGPEIQGGLETLTSELLSFRPNCVLLLGGSALHAFKEDYKLQVKKRKTPDGLAFAFPNPIGDWRGSKFLAQSIIPGTKCIASYHPAACLRNYSWSPYLLMDIRRAFDESRTPELVLPKRTLCISLSYEQLVDKLRSIKEQKPLISVDIEGGIGTMSCLSIATAADYSFIVPIAHRDGKSFYESIDQEVQILTLLADIFGDPAIPKVLQNSLYDLFVLQYSYKIIFRGVVDDTMLEHWELHSELEKSLGVQASLYTDEPFYKSERTSDDRDTFWEYCCKDSAVTFEIHEKLKKWLGPSSQQHYQFNRVLLRPLLYMGLKGIKFDVPAAKNRLKELETYLYEKQYQLDQIVGKGIQTKDKMVLRALVRDTMCYKNDPSRVKKDYEEIYDLDMRILVGEGELSNSQLGHIGMDLGTSFNVKGQQLKDYLYDTLGLPEQYDPRTKAVTADYEALLTLRKIANNPESPAKYRTDTIKRVLPVIIEMTELRTREQHLRKMVEASDSFQDGRIHAAYNEVGSETGRVTCGKFADGRGYPMQTIEDDNELKPTSSPLHLGLRSLLIADPGCYLAKCDLKGADGWTVGANLAALGERTMLDDLLFGLKPANILCYARRHGVASITGKTREELAILCKEVKKSDWDYFAYKQCIWGFCYLMGVRKAAQHVFNLSEGDVVVSEADMQQAKDMLLRRYRIDKWWQAMESKLFKQPYPSKLASPSGHIREFWDRRQEIVGQALAHEPQSVTTYATNRAVYKCWTDPENRFKSSTSITTIAGESIPWTKTHLHVEPMHQVHDEFLTQFKQDKVDWSLSKIRQWFNNPIRIAGIEITIPFDGAYGLNWAMDEKSKVGSI